MSLSEVVKFLILLLDREDIDLCLCERGRWHMLFYHLKQLPPTAGVPLALRDAFFDWDRPSPRCQELAESLWAFCLTGRVECFSPSLRDYRLAEGAAATWAEEFDHLGKEEKDFLERVALGYARKEFTMMAAA